LLRTLDILVHASTIPEPFGQAVIEGMAAGLPVIGADGGGVKDIITHGENGLLVPMGDAPALAEALESLLGDPETARRLGEAGRAHVRSHYTAAQSARKIEQVYREVLSVRRGREAVEKQTVGRRGGA
jgi:glycosyltransferase involved in cell wall biosynthesis